MGEIRLVDGGLAGVYRMECLISLLVLFMMLGIRIRIRIRIQMFSGRRIGWKFSLLTRNKTVEWGLFESCEGTSWACGGVGGMGFGGLGIRR